MPGLELRMMPYSLTPGFLDGNVMILETGPPVCPTAPSSGGTLES